MNNINLEQLKEQEVNKIQTSKFKGHKTIKNCLSRIMNLDDSINPLDFEFENLSVQEALQQTFLNANSVIEMCKAAKQNTDVFLSCCTEPTIRTIYEFFHESIKKKGMTKKFFDKFHDSNKHIFKKSELNKASMAFNSNIDMDKFDKESFYEWLKYQNALSSNTFFNLSIEKLINLESERYIQFADLIPVELTFVFSLKLNKNNDISNQSYVFITLDYIDKNDMESFKRSVYKINLCELINNKDLNILTNNIELFPNAGFLVEQSRELYEISKEV